MNKHIVIGLLLLEAFITTVHAQKIVSYEYWMDDNFTSRTIVSDTSTDIKLEVDASDLSQGMHYFNFRAKDSQGRYSAVMTQYFYKPQAATYTNNALTEYEYWIDDDFDARITTTNTDGVVNLEIDASGINRGMHYLNFRAKDNQGKYSAVATQYFYKFDATAGGSLIKYAVQFDDLKTDTVDIKASTSLVWTDKWLDVPTDDTISTLAHVTNVTQHNHEGIIDPEDWDKIWLKLTTEKERTLKLSFSNKGSEWLTTKDTFTHVNEHRLMAAPIQANYVYRIGEGKSTFAKYIRAKTGTLGLKSDRPCALNIYTDTERIASLTADSVARGAFITIPQDGTYYFVMQNQADPANPQSELKFICVNDPLPSPLHLADAGTLADLFTFTDEKSVKTLALTGQINGDDFRTMEAMENMRKLDLKDANVVRSTQQQSIHETQNDTIHYQAFIAMNNLEELDLPSSTRHVSDGAFEGTGDNLLVVNWNSTTAEIRPETFDADMGNSLIFAPKGTKNSYEGNVIVDGLAEHIELTDERPIRNPQDFRAKSVRYIRHFDKKTTPHQPGGWETLVLPFDVQTIWSEEKNCELTPFNSGTTGSRPFWLAHLTPQGFAHTTTIKANTPYIIAMPNSEAYEKEFNITGDVMFTAQDDEGVLFKNTIKQQRITGNEFILTPVYETRHQADTLYVINHSEYEGHVPGSLFVQNLRDAYPFEAYANILPTYQGWARSSFPIESNRNQATGIEMLYGNNHNKLTVQSLNGIISVTVSHPQTIGLYGADGKLIRLLNLQTGVNEIHGLPQGIYFIGNQKIKN